MTGRAYQRVQRNFGGRGYIYQLDFGDGFTYTVKLIRLYTLSVCSLLYVYYTTVKLGVK